MREKSVLLVEADPAMQRLLTDVLRDWGYEPVLASSAEEALSATANNWFLFTLVDANLDGGGTDFLRRLKIQGGARCPIIVLSDGDRGTSGVDGTFPGVDGVIRKPFIPEELENVVKEVLSHPRRIWGRPPDDDLASRLRQETALWRSPKMREVWEIIQQAARPDVTVLICGETGTGKDLVARAVHDLSSRQGGPFIKVNCAAVPRELLESELFGHERGAFTGAHQLQIGKFESANHGTIFLDEIGDLHPALQAKLLHVLQDGEFSRVGGKSTIKVDVRILAATNQDLERAVAAERFREDLYYRLNVIQIWVPPLRERAEEIPFLADYFVQRYSKLFHREGFTLSPAAEERLIQYRYPGNVRELENVIKRMIILGDPLLARTPFPGGRMDDGGDGSPETAQIPAVSLKDIARRAAGAAEREAMAKILEQTGWNRVRAAKLLKISYRALLYKIKQAGLSRARSSSRASA